MKKSKRTRSRNSSPNMSTKKKSQPQSIRGLITSRQQSMKTSSEVSAYTQKTQKTNTFASSQDFDFVDDQIEKQQIKDVFVSEEQEKVIQKILQVARKGKISQKNAFQIPLKVLDNQNASIGKAKFWKFASELLGASMSIYEKRIQNTWINTNLIHDKLARMIVKGNNTGEQENDDQNKKQLTSDYLMLPIEQFRDPKILDNIKIGEQTLQSTQKINIPKIKQQFTQDPLFQRKIKAFDNTSLKGLLLNVFDVGRNCQIQLYCNQSKLLVKENSKMIKNQCILPTQDKYLKQAIVKSKSNVSKQNLFNSILQFRRKNTFTSQKQQGVLDTIGFTPNNNKKDKQNPIFQQLQAFLNEQYERVDALQSQMPVYEDFLPNLDNNEQNIFSLEQNTVNSDFPKLSQQTLSQMTQDSPLTFYSDGPFSYNSADRSFHSVMTPWQMEFKQGKLKKKHVKRRQKREGKKKQKVQPGLVQFDALKVQNKTLILKQIKTQKNSRKSKKNRYNQNLVPPQLAVYQKINYKKVTQTQRKFTNQFKQVNQNLPDFLAPDPSMLHMNDQQLNKEQQQNQKHYSQINQEYAAQNLQQDALIFSNQRGQKPQIRYNIRQTKKILFEKVKDERQIRISQIDLGGIKPASILITFLHIANQKNMIVRNTKDEDDVILAWE